MEAESDVPGQWRATLNGLHKSVLLPELVRRIKRTQMRPRSQWVDFRHSSSSVRTHHNDHPLSRAWICNHKQFVHSWRRVLRRLQSYWFEGKGCCCWFHYPSVHPRVFDPQLCFSAIQSDIRQRVHGPRDIVCIGKIKFVHNQKVGILLGKRESPIHLARPLCFICVGQRDNGICGAALCQVHQRRHPHRDVLRHKERNFRHPRRCRILCTRARLGIVIVVERERVVPGSAFSIVRVPVPDRRCLRPVSWQVVAVRPEVLCPALSRHFEHKRSAVEIVMVRQAVGCLERDPCRGVGCPIPAVLAEMVSCGRIANVCLRGIPG
eukprot:m.295806 g.295806  ORF g.295806 m.295806 type:complete len:322 (+) comp20050_c0_seq1:116-1081(+)